MSHPDQLDGRYQLLREVGGGAMGAVYQALDTRLDRTVAIKTIRLASGDNDFAQFRLRFDREARSTGRLNHPNVVTVYDSGVAGDVAYISMEFLTGESLAVRISNGQPIPVPEAVEIVVQVAQALAYAHEKGVVHRDVKPGNIILLEDGLVKLTDFGIAQLANADMTQTGVILGTPKYMSPEQIAGSRVDGRADLFSLGVVFYELLTGRAPFQAPTLVSMMHTVLHSAPALPTAWTPAIPRALVSILARCLAKDPADRYGRAGDLVFDLRRFPKLDADEDRIHRVFSTLDASDGGPRAPVKPRVGSQAIGRALPVTTNALTALRRTFAPRPPTLRNTRLLAVALLAAVALGSLLSASNDLRATAAPPPVAEEIPATGSPSPAIAAPANPSAAKVTATDPVSTAAQSEPRSKKVSTHRTAPGAVALAKASLANSWSTFRRNAAKLYTQSRDCLRYDRCKSSASQKDTQARSD